MDKKPTVLVIMDGQGIGNHDKGDAVFCAKTPNLDKMKLKYGSIKMITFGEEVGLPSGQMGNSEVGHTNLGAGRVIRQGLSKINFSIKEKSYMKNKIILKAIKYAKDNKGKLNIMGLMSDGGVHSNMNHIYPIIEMANKEDVEVAIHAFLDGRDVSPTSGPKYIKELLNNIEGKNAYLSTISGRYYSLDRDTRWERIQLAYDALTQGKGNIFVDPIEYLEQQQKDGINDEFTVPAINKSKKGIIKENDSIFFINYRPDRARQMSHMFIGSKLWDYKPKLKLNNIYFASMMNYDQIECDLAFPPEFPVNTLGEWVDKKGLKQLRAAETEKYPHVTFFFDGGKERQWKYEEKLLVSSPKVATYDLQPEMSAIELTDKIINKISNFDLAIINYANPDMVGHTGIIPAVIKSVETIDKMVGRLYDKIVTELGGQMIITADHGNADKMLEEDGSPMTKHSVNPVSVIVVSEDFKFKKNFVKNYEAKLADIAPTMLTLLKQEIPSEMTGKVLVDKKY